MRMKSHRRSAFTLVELLVVITIIGMLVASVTPCREQRPRIGTADDVHE